jgi:hypothetical protein
MFSWWQLVIGYVHAFVTDIFFDLYCAGGRMLNNQTIVDVALQLVDSCWNTYASTA